MNNHSLIRRDSNQSAEEMASQMEASPRHQHWKGTPDGEKNLTAVVSGTLELLQPVTKTNFSDLAAVQGRAEAYVKSCVLAQRVPTFSGLACALGVSRKTLYKFAGRDNEVGQYLQRVSTAFADTLIQGGLTGGYHPILSIFLLRNSQNGFVNQDEIIVSQQPQSPLDDLNDEERAERLRQYLKALPEPLDEEGGD